MSERWATGDHDPSFKKFDCKVGGNRAKAKLSHGNFWCADPSLVYTFCQMLEIS